MISLFRRHKVESLLILGATSILCWTFFAAFITSGHYGDGELRALVPTTGIIFDSLLNFASTDDPDDNGTTADHSHRIYLAEDPATGKFAMSHWKHLSKKWDSKCTYARLLLRATTQSVEMLPSMMEPTTSSQSQSRSQLQQHPDERIIFILHNHPKMASTTLRRACWENLRSTCDVVSPKRDPIGYSNANDLAMLIDKCHNTHHFCVMGWHFHPNNFPNATLISSSSSYSSSRPTTYIHLFPFRNFDDWAVSAMKQVYVGHSEAGCEEVAKRLEKCDDGWLELDFTKYSKRAMTKMLGIIDEPQKIVQQQQQQQSAAKHHFLLYDYSQVHATLTMLERSYQVPRMAYLNMQYKQTRQDGTCSNRTLSRFHDCFDDQLLGL
mmetsp:Transcript_2730/g.4784  ORF Transcript_2730/g.4784 Transcript_2730/m.4784 type:complete len:381 (-) Transcript_2730:158-1300(-)